MGMTKSRYDLKSIIDLDKWHKLQDSLSLVTRMAIVTVDYKGVPVTKHSRCQAFCQLVREDPQLVAYCHKCDARGGLEAVRINKPYIYKCHFDVVDLAIPIIIDNQYIGALMAGQIRLKGEGESTLEQIVSRPKLTDDRYGKKRDELYAMMPVLSYDEVAEIAEMLFNLITYIVQEAIQKHEVIEMYKKAVAGQKPVASQDGANPPDLSLQNIQVIRQELSHALIQSHVKQTGLQPFAAVNSTLQPAFDYIGTHMHENFTLEAMARLCHISPSYFSRAFTKETGDNFSVYISRLKIEWAKQLLEGTSQPVNQIGNDLGFCDAGYFIKIFRKHENMTPAAYRAAFRRKVRE